MFNHIHIKDLEDYFVELHARKEKGGYFYRINGYSDNIARFIKKYYETARKSGVVIEGKIQNPDQKNLAYYQEIMGLDFRLDMSFILQSLQKWLPRMNEYQRNVVGKSIYNSLLEMRMAGKTENMLKNAYIKYMCWLYYKFERIINQLGNNCVPKILYEGEISHYELMLISILSNAGCDVILLQYKGDQAYLKEDKESKLSEVYDLESQIGFPQNYSLKAVRAEMQEEFNNQLLYGTLPKHINCTNAWIKGKGLDDFLEPVLTRGNDENLYYNCFCRINGVEDKLTYANELYQFHQALVSGKRKVVVVNGEIPSVTPEEVSQIKRNNYTKQDQMIRDLSNNIRYTYNVELQRALNKAFVDVILEVGKDAGCTLNKLINKAVYILCWLNRYQVQLFSNWKLPEISCFIHMGACKNDNEVLFLKFLSKLPVDVLILNPNLNEKCILNDRFLYEINHTESLAMTEFPLQNTQVRIGTAAFHAERELDTLMYHESGIYRNQQYSKANSICLQTMYEEIRILWDQELKYRPNFSVTNGVVSIPVIFSKICGVKDGMVQNYWNSIRELLTEDTLVIKKCPFVDSLDANSIKSLATEFYRNGRIQKEKIKHHPKFLYGYLREDVQDMILEKLQILIDQRTIKGTHENGTEYTIVSTILNLPKEILRMMQKFDFTKKNPKIVYISTTEKTISLEDSIIMAFLNLMGFDILFFVPTGYQTIEKYFNSIIMEEHQIGEYKYELTVPNLEEVSLNNTRLSWREKFLRRG